MITGMAIAPGHEVIISSNNPWGNKNFQTLDSFKTGIPGEGR